MKVSLLRQKYFLSAIYLVLPIVSPSYIITEVLVLWPMWWIPTRLKHFLKQNKLSKILIKLTLHPVL